MDMYQVHLPTQPIKLILRLYFAPIYNPYLLLLVILQQVRVDLYVVVLSLVCRHCKYPSYTFNK